MSMIENMINELNDMVSDMSDYDIMNFVAVRLDDWIKTINEAISTIQDLSEKLEAANMELKNDPLTLNDLREMANTCEGIYVAHPDGTSVFRGQQYCAAVLDYSIPFGEMETRIHAIYGDRLTFWEDDYGKIWLAYKRNPNDK